jgi:hypothetical protein
MNTSATWLGDLPLPGRWAVVGLVIGLIVHAPTAPFALVELGLPAAIVGGVIGLSTGVIVLAGRRIKQSRP